MPCGGLLESNAVGNINEKLSCERSSRSASPTTSNSDSPRKLTSVLKLKFACPIHSHFPDCVSETVINPIQSSQIKIPCRSAYIHRGILAVDISQHPRSFPPVARSTIRHTPSNAIYPFNALAVKTQPGNFRKWYLTCKLSTLA
jgi:hypothetical protein